MEVDGRPAVLELTAEAPTRTVTARAADTRRTGQGAALLAVLDDTVVLGEVLYVGRFGRRAPVLACERAAHAETDLRPDVSVEAWAASARPWPAGAAGAPEERPFELGQEAMVGRVAALRPAEARAEVSAAAAAGRRRAALSQTRPGGWPGSLRCSISIADKSGCLRAPGCDPDGMESLTSQNSDHPTR